MAADFTAIRGELLDIYDAIRDLNEEEILRAHPGIMDPPFRRLDQLAAMEIDDGVLEKLLAAPELKPSLVAISRLRNTYGLRLEIEQAHALLASSDPWETLEEFTFHENYQRLAAMEQQGAGLKSGDRIIFLGSGPLPLSLISLCSRYDLQGIGIEREDFFVDLSRQVVARLGLQEQITIRTGNHFSLPVMEPCQLLMVAAMARPREEIFRHLARSLPQGSLVAFRLYEKGLRRLLDRDGEITLPPEFKEYRRIRPLPPVNNTVVVVRRQ